MKMQKLKRILNVLRPTIPPARQGLYTAAGGGSVDQNPYTHGTQQSAHWIAGWMRAEANRKEGKDPRAQPAAIPHLCIKDVRLVCNCNTETQRQCTNALYPASTRKELVTILHKIVDRLVG